MGKPEVRSSSTKGKGGSALKRLRASLKDAGVLGKHNKISKKKSATQRAAALSSRKEARETLRSLSAKTRDSNPFELKITRQKHDVLGRKVKGSVGKPGMVRKRGEENRKRTLAVEMERKNKESAFVDRRFGEHDPNMSLEDKMLERFMKEKAKRSDKGSLFNLEDDDEELTHMGQSLSENAFNDAGFNRVDSDDEESGQIDQNTVKYSHFGGFSEDEGEEDETGKRKSKNEIMKELIAKSKMHKRDRQIQKEQDEELANELDAQLDDIRSLLGAGKPEPTKAPAPDSDMKDSLPTYDDYDQLIRTLAFERRAKPTDRLKTEEELALEEKTRLEKLERDRNRRMLGLPTEEEEEALKMKKRLEDAGEGKRVAQADDLGDDDYGVAIDKMVEMEEEMPLVYRDGRLLSKEVFMRKRKRVDGEDEQCEEDGESGEASESEDGSSDDGSDGEEAASEDGEDGYDIEADEEGWVELEGDLVEDSEDGEEQGSDDEEPEEDGVEHASAPTKHKTAKPTRKPDPSAAKELPYTFEAPETHEEFLELVHNRTAEEQATIVHRLRVLYNVKLGGDNRKKLETLLNILYTHITHLSTSPTPTTLQTINTLSPHIISLSHQFPTQSATHFLKTLITLQKRLSKSLNSPTRRRTALPSLHALLTFKLIGRIFSTSDLVHSVVTPALLLAGQYLSQCPVVDGVGAVRGLMLCEIVAEWVGYSRRVVPEVLGFLAVLLALGVPVKEEEESVEVESVPILEPGVKESRVEQWDAEFGELDLSQLLCGENAETLTQTEEFKLSLLISTTKLLNRFIRLYADQPAFHELFTPFLPLLNRIPHPTTQPTLSALQTHLQTIPLKRRPLLLQKHKPIPLPTYIPKFTTTYSLDRKKHDPNRDRAEKSKLKYEYKKEFKGAVRELRKDAAFVARKRREETIRKDEEYRTKMRRIEGQLAMQEGAMRGYEREMKNVRGKR